jgi:hypothetical protein
MAPSHHDLYANEGRQLKPKRRCRRTAGSIGANAALVGDA